MRPHGRAKVSTRSPEAFAICDGCGFLYNHSELRFQFQWAGNKLVNLRQLVCRRCNDIPQTQLRAIIIPADPMPVMNPRPQNYQRQLLTIARHQARTRLTRRLAFPFPVIPCVLLRMTNTALPSKLALRMEALMSFRVLTRMRSPTARSAMPLATDRAASA